MKRRAVFSNGDICESYNKSMNIKNDVPRNLSVVKLRSIRDTVRSLEESLKLSRNLEAEHCLRYSVLKMKNRVMVDDLKKANKRSKNMLNLFRQSVTDIHLGIEIPLPESLKRAVQRTWHEKYDTLLAEKDKLKREIVLADSKLEEKAKQIDDLQQKLLNLAESLTEREEALEKLCRKYSNLKARKNEREKLLAESVRKLKDELGEAHKMITGRNAGMNLISNKEALLTREIRRGDRLSHENALLRVLLQEARGEAKSNARNDTRVLTKT